MLTVLAHSAEANISFDSIHQFSPLIMDKTDTNSSFSSAADDEYLLRAVNAIEESSAAFSDISDDELCRFLHENSDASAPPVDSEQTALYEELAAFRDRWNDELVNSSRCVFTPPPPSSPPLAQIDLIDEELADVLRQIDSYESRQLPCAPPDRVNVGASTSAFVEDTPLKRRLKSSKGKEKAKKMAIHVENGM